MRPSRYVFTLLFLTALFAAHAQEKDTITRVLESKIVFPGMTESGRNVLVLGIGSARQLDTYLSPEEYKGTEIRIISQSERSLKRHPSWLQQLTHQGSLQQTAPRSEDNQELSALYAFDYSLRRWWMISPSVALAAGGQAETGIGFCYNTRNGNNPAQARAYLNVGPSAAAAWQFPNPLSRVFGWKDKTWLMRYDVSAPLFGALFSPNYGQSYYEIFSRGNYDHNIVATTPLCAPSFRHQIVLDIPIWHGTFQLGYLGDFQQAKVNNLKYHTYSHLFLIGFIYKK